MVVPLGKHIKSIWILEEVKLSPQLKGLRLSTKNLACCGRLVSDSGADGVAHYSKKIGEPGVCDGSMQMYMALYWRELICHFDLVWWS